MKNEFKVGDKVRRIDGGSYLNMKVGDIGTICHWNKSIYPNHFNLSEYPSDGTEGTFYKEYYELVEEECKPCCSGDIGENTYKRVISDAEEMNGLYEIPQDMCIGTLGDYKIYQTKINKKTIMSKITTFAKNLVLSADEKLLRKYGLKNECGEFTDEAESLVIAKLVKENESYLIELAKGMEVEEAKK